MFVKDPFSTVAAVSTPRGKGGVAVIRISGDDTEMIVSKCFVPKGKPFEERPYRQAVYGEIVSGGEVIDSGVAVLFEKGKSFTGESMAEISCHGGVWVTGAVLAAVIAAGAEPAGPGEFTKRAFINGKLSLSEAEAVGKLIDADTGSRAALASGAVRGNLTAAVGKISSELVDVMSALYAAIDYPDEDVGTEGEERILSVVSESLEKVKALRATYRTGRAVSDGVKTVICGRPNVGKSSLYNMLLGEERAIVTEFAGTTCDTLEDTADVGGVTLRLLDTAGIRDTENAVERIGVERAVAKIEGAELVIFVADTSEGLTDEDRELIGRLRNIPAEKIAVLNKSDLGGELSAEDEELIKTLTERTVVLSASTGEGRERLEREISSLFNETGIDLRCDAVIWSASQSAALDRALALLSSAKEALEEKRPLDAAGVLCEEAISELCMVDGRDVSEEIIDGIFSKFCVGK